MPPGRKQGKATVGPTIEALFGGLFGFVPGYLFMESIFRVYPHPAHWVGALIGVGGGYGVGTLTAAYKEGRPPFGTRVSRSLRRARPDARTRPGGHTTGVGDKRDTGGRRRTR